MLTLTVATATLNVIILTLKVVSATLSVIVLIFTVATARLCDNVDTNGCNCNA